MKEGLTVGQKRQGIGAPVLVLSAVGSTRHQFHRHVNASAPVMLTRSAQSRKCLMITCASVCVTTST